MTNNRCVIVLALLAMMSGFFFFPFNLFPLDPEKPVGSYLHNVWDFEDGLPQNAVMSICQTSDGYLWMATQEGLVRYNGNHFEVFDRDNTKEITNNYIRVLWEDRFGVLWIGTSGGGVLYLENGTFHRLSKGEDLSRSQISAFCSYGPGALLIATRESGIYKVKGGVASVYPLPPACKDNDVLSLLEDHEGNIWAGTDSGGLIKTGKKKAAVYLPGDEVRPPYVKGQAPVAGQPPVMEQTPVAGQARVAEQHGTKGQRLYVTGLPSRKINVLYQDEEKTIWIGTDAGITRYRDGGFKTFNVS
ncbi:MAG: hypothetical protein GY765_04345 [bacterium]|nr:hypothetical protein [bacterium]